jgi:hypothetical protein
MRSFIIFNNPQILLGTSSQENEVGRAHGFGGKTERKETTRKTDA